MLRFHTHTHTHTHTHRRYCSTQSVTLVSFSFFLSLAFTHGVISLSHTHTRAVDSTHAAAAHVYFSLSLSLSLSLSHARTASALSFSLARMATFGSRKAVRRCHPASVSSLSLSLSLALACKPIYSLPLSLLRRRSSSVHAVAVSLSPKSMRTTCARRHFSLARTCSRSLPASWPSNSSCNFALCRRCSCLIGLCRVCSVSVGVCVVVVCSRRQAADVTPSSSSSARLIFRQRSWPPRAHGHAHTRRTVLLNRVRRL